MLSRRKCLFWFASLSMAPFVSQRVVAAFPVLKEHHQQARRYRYRQDARRVKHVLYQTGQQCQNCVRYRDIDAWCSLFPEFSVNPEGWCDRWTLKSGKTLNTTPDQTSGAHNGYIPIRSVRDKNE